MARARSHNKSLVALSDHPSIRWKIMHHQHPGSKQTPSPDRRSRLVAQRFCEVDDLVAKARAIWSPRQCSAQRRVTHRSRAVVRRSQEIDVVSKVSTEWAEM